MRRTLAAVALAVVAALLPLPATAQEPAAPLLEDDSGDVMVAVQGAPGQPTTLYPAADLRSLSIVEEPGAFAFAVEVEDLKAGSEDTGADGTRIEVSFVHNGRQFRVDFMRSLPAVSDFPTAWVRYRDQPDDAWATAWVDFQSVRVDLQSDQWSVAIPRDVFVDRDGAVPFPGRAFEDIRVLGRSAFSNGNVNVFNGVQQQLPYSASDTMPEPDEAGAVLPIQLGVQQTGNVRLWSEAPFRASNGEATTYVLEVEVHNLDDEPDVVELVASQVPSSLTVVLPVPLVALDDEDARTVPVLVTVPFGHDHGSAARFLLEGFSQNDAASVGRLEMGVRFLAVPQPAGHHDRLYLHSTPSGGGTALGVLDFSEGSMNTVPDDGTDTPFRSGGGGWGITQSWFGWDYALTPALEMGLDLDLFRDGELSIPIQTPLPLMQATLTAQLYVAGGEDAVAVATLEGTDPQDIDAGETVVFTGTLTPHEDADEIPFMPGQNLYLWIELTGTGAPAFGIVEDDPVILPGGWLRLPLNEWHDPVDDALAALDGPSLRALGPQERPVNPGEGVLFDVTVTNPDDSERVVRLEATGPNADWAVLPGEVTVPGEGSANVTVLVRAPAAALHGDRADLILHAYTKQEPDVRGLLRLVAQVDTKEDHADETAGAPDLSGKGSPPAMPGLVAAGLVLAALLRRRRA